MLDVIVMRPVEDQVNMRHNDGSRLLLGQSCRQQSIPQLLDDGRFFQLHLSMHKLAIHVTNIVHFHADGSASVAAQDNCVLIDYAQRGER